MQKKISFTRSFFRLGGLLGLIVFLQTPFFCFADSQDEPNITTSLVDWSVAGYDGEVPYYPATVNVIDFGAVGDGTTDNFTAFQNALNATMEGEAVYIPPGTYLLNSTLALLQGRVLRGECPSNTVLQFDLGENNVDCIEILTYQYGTYTAVTGGFTKGSSTLTVADASNFTVGSYAELEQENDAALMYTSSTWNVSWAANSVGQMLKITAINGNELTISPPLSISYNSSLNPQVRPTGLIENVGIENLKLERLDAGDGYTVLIKNAANCWVHNVESAFTYRSHIIIDSGIHIDIRDNYFHHAHDYGGGGHGYGVTCGDHATACLIENNVFHTLRHAMMVKQGANMNVFGYNYSYDPHWDISTTNIPPDISLHGHYPNMNLFEGNIVQEPTSADYWGPSGPGNTFFRNRIATSDLKVADYSHEQYIIGNELVGIANVINIDASVLNTFIHGNIENGMVTWDANCPSMTLADSYYLNGTPTFWNDLPFPAFGPEFLANPNTIPAKVRHDSGQILQNCPIRVQATVFLEGAYDVSNGGMQTTLRTNQLIPLTQPFDTNPWNYSGNERVQELTAIPTNAVDWVLVEVRNGADSNDMLEQRAGFLLADGSIVAAQPLFAGDVGLYFYELNEGENYYMAIKTRNHLAALSAVTVALPNAVPYDFSQAANVAGSIELLANMGDGNFALSAGDTNAEGIISVADFNQYIAESASVNQYADADFNLDGQVSVLDFNFYLPNAGLIGVSAVRY